MLKKILQGCLALAWFCSLVGWLRGPWWFELFAHFRLQYTLGLLILLPLLYKVRDSRLWGLWGLIFILNASTLLQFFQVRPGSGPPGGRLLLCNVLATHRSPDQVVAFLQREQADVVVLVETTYAWVERIRPVATAYAGQVWVPHLDDCGMVLLTRRPVQNVTVLDREGIPMIFADTYLAGQRLHLVAAHPMAPVHAAATQRRNAQLQTLVEHLADCPRPFVVLGDLNNTPWAPSMAPLQASARSARKGFGLMPSWPTLLPYFMRIPIDHALVSAEVEVTDCELGPAIGSDHFPLRVEVRL
jgi:endonuclease/exonuclease/phosphatase (EEP) superfamily protein YafD